MISIFVNRTFVNKRVTGHEGCGVVVVVGTVVPSVVVGMSAGSVSVPSQA